jgi:hypothetical protein
MATLGCGNFDPSRFVTFASSLVGTSNAMAATILFVPSVPIAIEVFLLAH